MKADCMDVSEALEKKCGTCKWFEKSEASEVFGYCKFPLPALPWSIVKSLRRSSPYGISYLAPIKANWERFLRERSEIEGAKDMVFDYETDCPTWEEKA
jgi:hypothetical protein